MTAPDDLRARVLASVNEWAHSSGTLDDLALAVARMVQAQEREACAEECDRWYRASSAAVAIRQRAGEI